MSRAKEAFRRLGTKFCPRCGDRMEEPYSVFDWTTEPMKQITGICVTCVGRQKEVNEEHIQRQVTRDAEERDRQWQNQEDVRRLVEPNGPEFTEEQQRYKDDLEAAEDWCIGNSIFGPSQD